MARVTVEDCLDHVENRFKLVLVAAKRARQLAKNGALSRVPGENDKPTVLALREIAAGYVEFKEETPESSSSDVTVIIEERPSQEPTSKETEEH